jgi:hypothetical protein
MSCAYVLAISEIGIVCTDTRLNMSITDGSRRINDEGVFHHVLQDGTVETLKTQGRKSKVFPGGYAAGAGQFDLIRICLKELSNRNARTPTSINGIIRQSFADNIEWVKTKYPNDVNVENSVILYIYETRNGFKMSGVSSSDAISVPSEGHFFLAFPPEMTTQDQEQARSSLRLIKPPKNLEDIASIIRTICGAFHFVYTKSSTVSDLADTTVFMRLDTGITVKRNLLLNNETVINMRQEDIVQLIQ